MAFQLERFRITGLHGVRTVDIPITDNKLILVGENGTGKTTVANCIYFFITRQWNRMVDSYRFESIEITLNSEGKSEKIELNHEDIPARSKISSSRPSSLSRSRLQHIERIISPFTPSDILDDEALREQLSHQLRIPERILLEYLISKLLDDNQGSNTKRFDRVQAQLSEMIKEPALYLPTFRRIEKDLQYIYPQLDLDEFKYRRRRRHFPDRTNRPYIELVEFGMEDVNRTINNVMSNLKESLRKSLNDLTWTYLREVIRVEYENVDHEPLLELTESEIDAILDKVEENLLPLEEKRTLREIIASLRSGDGIENPVVIHFLVRLVELHKQQEENEQAVVKFVEVCNGYLRDKHLTFDSTQFEIHISHNQEEEETRQDIEMGVLSSGEKQIVSLFSHIYLSGRKDFFVVIDEPELSLSVPWQKKFLPDILATNKCAGLIAVTHSPFIFDNELDSFAHDIKEFWV